MFDKRPRLMFGMAERVYNYQATLFCKLVVAVWLMGGGVYALCAGNLFSLPTLALFLPGVFVASLAAFLGFVVYAKSMQVVDALEARGARSLCGLVSTAGLVWWMIAALLAPVCLSILYIQFVGEMVARF